MEKKVLEKDVYISPACTIIGMQQEQFFCTSVRPNAGGSTVNPGYDDKGEHDGGTIHFGDKNSIAPGKQGWFDEEDEDFEM